jgi:hypothetical protein
MSFGEPIIIGGGGGGSGSPGAPGDNGWSPVYASVVNGAFRVEQLSDWIGGTGTKPGGIGKYKGAAGLVDAIGDAVDVRGPAGAAGGKGDQGLKGDQGIQGPTGATLTAPFTFGYTSMTMGASELVGQHTLDVAQELNFVGSTAFADAPSAGAVWTIKIILNPATGVETVIGTITWTAANNIGVFARDAGVALGTVFAAGSILRLYTDPAGIPPFTNCSINIKLPVH